MKAHLTQQHAGIQSCAEFDQACLHLLDIDVKEPDLNFRGHSRPMPAT
jgi:hypothetical protein